MSPPVTLSSVSMPCMGIYFWKTILQPRLVMCRRNPPLSMQATIHSTSQIRTSRNIGNVVYNCYCLIFLCYECCLSLFLRFFLHLQWCVRKKLCMAFKHVQWWIQVGGHGSHAVGPAFRLGDHVILFTNEKGMSYNADAIVL